MLSKKVDCLKAMRQHVPSKIKDVEIHAYVFSALITGLDNLTSGCDTHLGFLKNIFVDSFKFL